MALIEINWRPDRRQLRGFGIICVAAFGAIGAWIFFRRTIFGIDLEGSLGSNLAFVLWALAGTCGLLSLGAPAALRPLYVLLSAITLPIGFIISHIVMGVLFYLILTPMGLIMRLLGRDPLCRRFDPAASSYWVRRRPTTDVKRYYRQF